MTKPTLFFSTECPDTAPFVAELQRLGVQYEEVNVLSSLKNLKCFLKLRDTHHAFDNAKQNGGIGIPALLLGNERVIIDITELAKFLN